MKRRNNMQYKDEEIMMKKKAAAKAAVDEALEQKKEEEKKESIYDEFVHMEGKEVTFSRRDIGDIGISIYMPDIFEPLDEEMKATLYPFGNAPQYAFAEFGLPFQFTLTKTQHIVPDDGIPKLMEMAAKVMDYYGPKSKILGKGVIRLHDHNIGIIEAVTRALDGNVHNVMFYISIDNQIRLGNIHFATKYADRMIPISKQMIDSIEFLEEQSDGNDHISES